MKYRGDCMQKSLEDVRDTLLDMAGERDISALMQLTAKQLCTRQDVALVRLWIYTDDDNCETCSLREDSPDKSSCLHLAASEGRPLASGENWNRIDGQFHRIPLGVRKVGHVAKTREPVEIRDVSEGSHWIADPEWARRESIKGFIGLPLIHRDELIGVLGVFLRVQVVENALLSLRMVVDHLASAIVNARAFEEINELRSRLASENEYLKEELNTARPYDGIVGTSAAIQAALEKTALVAPTDTTALILGESGTGKELIARAIHDQSGFKDGPLIRVNCASIPRELFESEFFGHVKGSFTGALQDRIGRFELATKGTLFLDEIGEVPLEMQSKLLRVLQEKTYERIGDAVTRKSKCRIVAATNKDLKAEVAKRTFREDLYYRLSVFPIEVPPLRERKQDIAVLARYFLELHCGRFGVAVPKLRKRDCDALKEYAWPGNVRELQNVVEQAALRLRTGPLRFQLPRNETPNERVATDFESQASSEPMTYEQLKEFERQNLLTTLKQTNWKIYGPRGAAERLGIHPATLTSKMKAMGIVRPT